MQYCRDRIKSPNLVFFALTGDGVLERNLLESLAKKYNGYDKTICFPNPPIKNPFTKKQGRTGLSALKAIMIDTGNWKINNYIYLVDREHVKTYNEIQNYLVKLKFMTNLTLDQNVINGRYGLHDIQILCSINGKIKFIEENFSDLIKIKNGDSVPPSKKDIHNYLRNKKTDYKKIFDSCSKNQIKRAFPDISRIIEIIEEM